MGILSALRVALSFFLMLLVLVGNAAYVGLLTEDIFWTLLTEGADYISALGLKVMENTHWLIDSLSPHILPGL